MSYQNESFSSKWELPCLPPSSLKLWRRERASKQLSFWRETLIFIGHYSIHQINIFSFKSKKYIGLGPTFHQLWWWILPCPTCTLSTQLLYKVEQIYLLSLTSSLLGEIIFTLVRTYLSENTKKITSLAADLSLTQLCFCGFAAILQWNSSVSSDR